MRSSSTAGGSSRIVLRSRNQARVLSSPPTPSSRNASKVSRLGRTSSYWRAGPPGGRVSGTSSRASSPCPRAASTSCPSSARARSRSTGLMLYEKRATYMAHLRTSTRRPSRVRSVCAEATHGSRSRMSSRTARAADGDLRGSISACAKHDDRPHPGAGVAPAFPLRSSSSTVSASARACSKVSARPATADA